MKKTVGIKLFWAGCLLACLTAVIFTLTKRFSQPDLTVMGYVNLADGLGRQGPELVEAFKKEMKVNFQQTRKIKGTKIPKKLKKHVEKDTKNWGKVLVFEDILWGPWDGFTTSKLSNCPKDTIKIAYSMYEATQIPHEWVKILNKKFDAVIVPSHFLIKVYEESGVKIPIFEIPLGLNLKRFMDAPLKEKSHSPLVFSNFSAGSERKNHLMLIRAFAKAFGDDPSVLLRINVRYSEKEVRNEITKELATLNVKNIVFTQSPLSKGNYLELFRETDCYVSPSKGEGFSIQPREAMAMGIPVIVTNNTGQTSICESGLVKVINSPIREIAVNPWGDYYGYNFNCDLEELAAALTEMKQNYDHYLSKNKEARKWASQFQYSELKTLYRTIIKPKKVVFDRENKVTPECLFTNSTTLLFKYQKLFGKKVAELDNESIFTKIYETGEWGRNEKGEGFSGLGSSLENATPYMMCLQDFIKKNNIKSVVDLGCGDWTFSQEINWDGVQYTGIDVVKRLIDKNNELFASENIRFIHEDAVKADFPPADLLICKDVLQHLSNKDVARILKQISKYNHCLITNDVNPETDTADNREIYSGGARELDLTTAPFNLRGNQVLKYDAHGVRKVVLHIQN